MRKAFAAKDENHLLIDADYFQIELRVLADIANDESFIASFLNDEDICSHGLGSISVYRWIW